MILLNSSGLKIRYPLILRACRFPIVRYFIPYLMLVPRDLKLWIRARIYPRTEFFQTLLREFRLATLTLRTWKGLTASLKAIKNITSEDYLDARLEGIRCPTLIVWGDRDEALPREMADFFHSRIAGSRLHIIQDCGHNIPEERPRESVETIRNFLDERG